MEHIRATIASNTGTDAEPLRVVGVVNEILQETESLQSEAAATAWQPPVVIVRAHSAVVLALLRQQNDQLLHQINDRLRNRYGGPLVERLVVRLATEQ